MPTLFVLPVFVQTSFPYDSEWANPKMAELFAPTLSECAKVSLPLPVPIHCCHPCASFSLIAAISTGPRGFPAQKGRCAPFLQVGKPLSRTLGPPLCLPSHNAHPHTMHTLPPSTASIRMVRQRTFTPRTRAALWSREPSGPPPSGFMPSHSDRRSGMARHSTE